MSRGISVVKAPGETHIQQLFICKHLAVLNQQNLCQNPTYHSPVQLSVCEHGLGRYNVSHWNRHLIFLWLTSTYFVFNGISFFYVYWNQVQRWIQIAISLSLAILFTISQTWWNNIIGFSCYFAEVVAPLKCNQVFIVPINEVRERERELALVMCKSPCYFQMEENVLWFCLSGK